MIKVLLQGNEACVEGALKAGVNFFAGYPITPSTEIAEKMAEKLPLRGGVFIQMEDEIASMAAIIGASIAGAKAMTATSGPGFSLMQENIGYAAMTEIPVVVVDVQRGGPSTGTPTMPSQGDLMQARWGTHGDHPIIVLAPSSVQEAYDLSITAVNMAEKYMTPVIILMDEVIAHMREGIELKEPTAISSRPKTTSPPESYLPYQTEADNIPRLAPFGTGYRYHITGLYHDQAGFPTNNQPQIEAALRRLHAKIDNHQEDIVLIESENTEDAELIFISYGAPIRSARHVMRQMRKQGKKVGLVQLVTLWPFPHIFLTGLAQSTKAKFAVPELSMGQLAGELQKSIPVDRIIPVSRIDGALITPGQLEAALKGVL